MKLDLTWRFGLFLAVGMLAVGLVATGTVLYFDLNYHRQRIIEQIHTLTSLATELARYPMYVGDVAELQRLLKALASLSEFEGAAVVDTDCRPLASQGQRFERCFTAQLPASNWELLSRPTVEFWLPVKADTGEEAALFPTEPKTIGYLWLRLSLASFKNQIQNLLFTVFGGLLLLLLGAIGATIWHLRIRLLSPLMALEKKFQLLMAGHARSSELPKAAPEIQSLHSAFNQMLNWLEDQRQQLETLAYRDSLTKLGNRAFLEEQLNKFLSLGQRQGFSLALLFLDLDRFKVVNDALGHGMGDSLLREVSILLERQLRSEDVLTRMGGDEFVILLPALSAERHQAHLQALTVAEKILNALTRPITVGQHEITISCSLGIALAPHDAKDAETLLRYADSALYQAKAAGRNAYRFFHRQLAEHAEYQLNLETALRNAVKNDELEIYLQPQVEYPQNCIVGAEALLRWNHQGDWIPPDEFVPLLEETGLMFEVTERTIACLMEHKHRWWRRGYLGKLRHLAVNLSPILLWRSDLTNRLIPLLCRDENCPTRLELELTESALIEPQPALLAVLEKLREAGVLLSIDDFGTGYSNLNHLRHLPIDALKIDKTFVHNLENPTDLALVKAICAIGDSLMVKIVAEGVESEHQARQLCMLGCHIMQGYYFYRPMPIAQFEALLQKQAHRCSA